MELALLNLQGYDISFHHPLLSQKKHQQSVGLGSSLGLGKELQLDPAARQRFQAINNLFSPVS